MIDLIENKKTIGLALALIAECPSCKLSGEWAKEDSMVRYFIDGFDGFVRLECKKCNKKQDTLVSFGPHPVR